MTCLWLLLLPGALLAQEEAIGVVIAVKGSVEAHSAAGAAGRALGRGDDIFAADTLVTGQNGTAQVRLRDRGVIAFQPNTEFQFSEFLYDGPGGAGDSALMNLVRGGFRTITGTIGDDDADTYQIATPYASIGIRGTTHEAVIDPVSNSLITGVWDGGTTVSNNQGSIDLGINANFDFSQTFPGAAPIGLLEEPVQLGTIDLDPDLDLDEDANGGDPAEGGGGQAQAAAPAPAQEEPPAALQEEELEAGSQAFAGSAPAAGNPAGVEQLSSRASSSPNSVLAQSTGDDTEATINPVQSVRSVNALTSENPEPGNSGNGNAGGNGQGNSDNGNAGGNGQGNSDNGNGNAGGNGQGNSNAGGGNPATGGGSNPDTGGGSNSNAGSGSTPTTGGGSNPNAGGGNNPNAGGGSNSDTGTGSSPTTGGGNNSNAGGGNNSNAGGGNGNNSGSGGVFVPGLGTMKRLLADEGLQAPEYLSVAGASTRPGAFTSTYSPNEEAEIDWGYWNEDDTIISPANYSGAVTPFNELVYWASVLPADMEALRDFAAQWKFSTASGKDFIGSASNGLLNALDMGFTVDLGTGAISQGRFEAQAGAQTWNLNFNGTVEGSRARMHSFSNTRITNGIGVESSIIRGTIEGIFFGSPDQAGFVSGFSLEGGNGSTLQGLGVLKGAAQ